MRFDLQAVLKKLVNRATDGRAPQAHSVCNDLNARRKTQPQRTCAVRSARRSWRRASLSARIERFADRDSDRLFHREPVRRRPGALHLVMLRELRQVEAAIASDDLRVPPEPRLQKLRVERVGQHSICVSDPWRICFR